MKIGVTGSLYLALMISTVLPLLVMLHMGARGKIQFKLFAYGAGIYLAVQAAAVPFLLNQLKRYSFMNGSLPAMVITAALSAAMDILSFVLLFRYLLKNNRSYTAAISIGFGRGILESVCLTGIPFIADLSVLMAADSGTISQMSVADQKSVQTAAAFLKGISGEEFLLSAVYEVSSMVMVTALICLMLIYFKSWNMRKFTGTTAAMTCIRLTGVFLGKQSFRLLLCYSLAVLTASLWILYKIKRQVDCFSKNRKKEKEVVNE
ncbi:YhfC family glutamic-type intramembrane protease [Lachnospiraceae bacterium 54-53]